MEKPVFRVGWPVLLFASSRLSASCLTSTLHGPTPLHLGPNPKFSFSLGSRVCPAEVWWWFSPPPPSAAAATALSPLACLPCFTPLVCHSSHRCPWFGSSSGYWPRATLF